MAINIFDPKLQELADKLKDIVEEDDAYHPAVTVLASALQSAFLTTLAFRGSLADGIASFVFGACANILTHLADHFRMTQGIPIFVAFLIAFICRMFESSSLWRWTGNAGICHDTVILSSLICYLPGMQFTLSMLEVGSQFATAGAVRIFMAFARSLKLGFGISLGSRFAIHFLQMLNIWSETENVGVCPSSDDKSMTEWWRMMCYIPMSLGIMISLKAHHSQFLVMFMASTTAFLTAKLTENRVSQEMSLVLTSFALGIVANIIARRSNTIAISSIFGGIFWILPGALGLKGAASAFATEGGSSFVITILMRTLSTVIGLYMANMIVFPMSPSKRTSAEEAHMAI